MPTFTSDTILNEESAFNIRVKECLAESHPNFLFGNHNYTVGLGVNYSTAIDFVEKKVCIIDCGELIRNSYSNVRHQSFTRFTQLSDHNLYNITAFSFISDAHDGFVTPQVKIESSMIYNSYTEECNGKEFYICHFLNERVIFDIERSELKIGQRVIGNFNMLENIASFEKKIYTDERTYIIFEDICPRQCSEFAMFFITYEQDTFSCFEIDIDQIPIRVYPSDFGDLTVAIDSFGGPEFVSIEQGVMQRWSVESEGYSVYGFIRPHLCVLADGVYDTSRRKLHRWDQCLVLNFYVICAEGKLIQAQQTETGFILTHHVITVDNDDVGVRIYEEELSLDSIVEDFSVSLVNIEIQ
ncbi:hypothetical protein PCE1_004497 [Barthelona sp. PCE]